MDRQNLLAQFDALYNDYTATGQQLLQNFLTIARIA